MGREVRRVPAHWKHPRDEEGDYIPQNGDSFLQDLREWQEGKEKWEQGFREKWHFNGPHEWVLKDAEEQKMSYEEWAGPEPQEAEYMPDWPEAHRTHYQMYETCTEGTPISPVMASPEELARWLDDNGASAFEDMTATYEQWLNTIRQSSACDMVLEPGKGIQSGVAAGI